MEAEHLHVINNPDAPAVCCDFASDVILRVSPVDVRTEI